MNRLFKRKWMVALFVALITSLALATFTACKSFDTPKFHVTPETTEITYGEGVKFTYHATKLSDDGVGGYAEEDAEEAYKAIKCVQGYQITYTEGEEAFTVQLSTEGEVELSFTWNGMTSNTVVINVKREVKYITTADELLQASNPSCRYVLQNDIDLSSHTSHAPIEFQGALDGNGYSIQNFTYMPQNLATDKAMGFFSVNHGIIENVTFANAFVGIYSQAASAGIVVGLNNGTVRNVTVSGELEAEQTNKVGAVVGNNAGTIEDCINRATVLGKDLTGGIAGESVSAVSGSKNVGNVEGQSKVGGIVGAVTKSSTVYGSENSGSVEGTTNVGGIVGFTDPSVAVNVNSSANVGDVNGKSNVGGIIGAGDSVDLFACENGGLVHGNSQYVGGIGGFIRSARRCQNNGAVSAEGNDIAATDGYYNVYVGGIAGHSKRVEECKNVQRIELFAESGAYVGGITGYLEGDNTTDAMNGNVNEGNILAPSTSSYVGGIAGNMKNATLRGAQNSGNVAGGLYTAGICGYAQSGAIYFSGNTGVISGTQTAQIAIIAQSGNGDDLAATFGNEKNGSVSARGDLE